MATHCSIPAWRIPWTGEPGGLHAVHGVAKSRTRLCDFTFTFPFHGEGNGNPLQCSCLENPRDGRAWWPAVYGVAQSRTRLRQLSGSGSGRNLQNSNTYVEFTQINHFNYYLSLSMNYNPTWAFIDSSHNLQPTG